MDRATEQQLQEANSALREALAKAQADLAKTQAELEEERAQREAAEQAVLRLLRDIEKLKRQVTGSKSERVVDPDQLELPMGPDDDEADAAGEASGVNEEAEQTGAGPDKKKKKRKPRKGSRRRVSEMHDLRIEEHRSEVTDRLCPCGCGAEAQTIGHDVSWRLDYKPAELIRVKCVQEKVSFPDHIGAEKGTVVTAEPPLPFALPKAMCGNRLLAQIAIDKYADHLPLYRQEARFKREGVHMPRTTLCDWAMELGQVVSPIYRYMSREVLGGDWLRADATGMPVIDKTRSRGKAHRGHLWAWGNYETVLFSYTPDKKAETVVSLFPDFKGTVLIDGASDFNLLEKVDGVERAGCWAHARRYFYEALTEDRKLAMQGLGIIRELFMVERVVMASAVDERTALREELSKPVLDGIRKWVDETLPKQVPGSSIHRALQYVDNQWSRLCVFLTKPHIACHNNDSERDLRRPVKGRDNWQFAGSPRGARMAAVHYSLIGTCLLQGIDPLRYLVEILGRLDEPARNLTPHALREQWQAAERAK